MRTASALPFLLLAAAMASPPRAAADPYTSKFGDLIQEMNDRDGALVGDLAPAEKRQKAALRRGFRAIARDSDSLAGDLGMAIAVARALGAGFPGDATFAALLDGTLDGLAADVVGARDSLAIVVLGLSPGKPKERGEAGVAAADAVLAEAAAAVDPADRAKALRRAEKGVRKTLKAVTSGGTGGGGGTSTMTATVDGTPFESNALFGTPVSGILGVSPSGGTRRILVAGRQWFPSSGDDKVPGEVRTLQISMTATGADLAPGTYALGTGSGALVTATWVDELEDGSAATWVGTAGTVTLDDVTPGLGRVEGSFALTLYDGVGGVSHAVTAGAFAVIDLPRTASP